ncbi:MAG: hypothetical protein GC168_11740 [Candidatus Hydrogenedens sp.]|nr:hypothetical protein [Candidatus Hydrogenedens sp.]
MWRYVLSSALLVGIVAGIYVYAGLSRVGIHVVNQRDVAINLILYPDEYARTTGKFGREYAVPPHSRRFVPIRYVAQSDNAVELELIYGGPERTSWVLTEYDSKSKSEADVANGPMKLKGFPGAQETLYIGTGNQVNHIRSRWPEMLFK